MDNITALLLRLSYSVITDSPVELSAAPDTQTLQALYDFSRKHELAHLACEGLLRANALPNDELGAKFRKQRMAAIFSDERKQQAMEQVCACLSREQIPYMPLKGSLLRSYYPEPWMRSRCDIDVLVHPEDLDRACRALEGEGYVCEGKFAHDVSLMSPAKVHLELHFMLQQSSKNYMIPLLDRVWDYASPRTDDAFHYVLSDAMFYYYHVAHIAKHIRYAGCGLRPFLDLWLLDRAENADRDGRDALLEQGGLLTFARSAGKLAACWYENAPCTDPVSRQLEDYVVSSGIYGQEEIRVANSESSGSVLRQIFPTYAQLSVTYSVLQDKPWLFPVYQVVRWKDGLKRTGLRRKLRKMKSEKTIYEQQHDSTRSLMEELGLWKLEK